MNIFRSRMPIGVTEVLTQANFRRIWLAGIISVFGDILYNLATLWFVGEETGSALAVGSVVISAALPALLFGLVGGALADRIDRRKIMVGADLIRAFLVILIPLLYYFDVLLLPAILLITFLREGLGFFFFPAQQSVIPLTVSKDQLSQANSLNQTSRLLVSAAAPAVSGVLIAVVGPIAVLYIDAMTFLLSAAFLWKLDIKTVSVTEHKRTLSINSLLRDIQEGLVYITKSPSLRLLLFVSLINIFGFGPYRPIALLFFQNEVGMTTSQYGLNLSIYFVGLTVGSAIAGPLGKLMGSGRLFVLSHVIMGVATIAVGLITWLTAIYGLTALRAIGNGLLSVAFITLLQHQTSDEHRGRVFGTLDTITESVRPLTVAAAIFIVDFVGLRLTVISSGMFFIAAAIIAISLIFTQHVDSTKKASLGSVES